MDYGCAGYIIEYRARNSSQINVAITTGRPRVLYRSIISPSITRIDLSRAASFVCPTRRLPRTNDSVVWQPFYFLSPSLFFPFPSHPPFFPGPVDFQGFATLSGNICRREKSVSRGWDIVVRDRAKLPRHWIPHLAAAITFRDENCQEGIVTRGRLIAARKPRRSVNRVRVTRVHVCMRK